MQTDQLTFKYTVDEAMQCESIRQYFRHVIVGRKWWLALPSFIFFLLGLIFRVPVMAAIFGTLCGFFLLVLVGVYFQLTRQAQQSLALLSNREMTLTLGKKTVELEVGDNRRSVSWDKMTRLVETRDFLILLSNQVPAANLPKSMLTDEAMRLIHRRVAGHVQ